MIKKSILFACDYTLKENIFGGMDEFFLQINDELLQHCDVYWVFSPKSELYLNRYSRMNIIQPATDNFYKNVSCAIKGMPTAPHLIVTHFVDFINSRNKEWKELGVKKILVVDHTARPIGGFSLKKRIKLKLRSLFYNQYVNGIIFVSDYVKKCAESEYLSFLSSFPQKYVIRNGINLSKYSPLSLNNNIEIIKLVSVGNLYIHKGFQYAIEAISLLDDEKKSKIQYDIIGDGPYRYELEKLIESYNLSNCIHLLGSKNNINEFLYNYDISIQSSLWDNVPFTIFEAFASGVPVIASRVGGIPELLKDGQNGWLFKCKDARELSSKLSAIINMSKEEIVMLKRNAAQYAQQEMSITKMIEEHINTYLTYL